MDKPETIKTSKHHAEYLLASIRKIAAAFNVELSEATQAVYMEFLAPLSEENIYNATSKTILEWKEPSKMPPPIFILERYWNSIQPLTEETRKILDRDDKPPDWKELGRKNGVTWEEINGWLEKGRREQLAYYAKLEADPEWQKMAARLGAKLNPPV